MIDSLTLDLISIGILIFSAILECISAGILFITAAVVIWQVIVMRRDTQAQAYGVAREILQDEKVRKARKRVFELCSVEFIDWEKSDKEQAEIVCHTYDSVGQMVKYSLLRKDIIIDSWGGSIRNMWPIVEDLVLEYRERFGVDEYWDDFKWLYDKAIEAEKAKKAREKK